MVHDLPQRSQLWNTPGAHKGKISGLCFAGDDRLLSCGVDRNVKLWDTRAQSDVDGMPDGAGPSQVCIPSLQSVKLNAEYFQARKPLKVFPGKYAFKLV